MNLFSEFGYCRGSWGVLDSRFSLKGTLPVYAPSRSFDTEHIFLDLVLDIRNRALKGRCSTRLRAITSQAQDMVFDAVNFRIKRIRWNNQHMKYEYKDGKIFLSLKMPLKEGARAVVDIDYEVREPKLGLYFIKPDKNYPHRPTQVWTQSQDEYARFWFPCHDAPHERTTTELRVQVPTGFTAVSNGRLVSTSHQPRKWVSVYHWKQDIPHATYLVTLTAGRFSLIKDSWRGKSVLYYCEKGREADAKRAFGNTPRMMEFFSKFIGTTYPYAKYAQVAAADFIYGGMENTSATTQTDTALLDERSTLDYTSDELVAHELAHQWFGDYLTCKDWSHAWLNESFATYFDALYKRLDKGNDEFLHALRNNAELYFQEDKDHYRRPIVTKVYRRPSDLFDRHLYEKGSLVLHMLHTLIGEELFRKAIALYVRKNKQQVVETTDLINAIEQVTGRNMRRFFDQWVFGSGHPEFKIRYWWDNQQKKVKVRVTQTQATNSETALFEVETSLLFVTGQGEVKKPIKIVKKSHLFEFSFDAQPTLVLFDPDWAVLKKVDFPRPENMLLIQLFQAKSPLARIEAADELAKAGNPQVLTSLKRALTTESFWGVQCEIASAIARFNSEAAMTILLESLETIQHPKVRRSIFAGLRQFKSSKVFEALEKKLAYEKSYFAQGEALRAIGALNSTRTAQILKEFLKKDSWNDITRISALEALALSKSKEYLPLFLSYTRPGHHQRLRMAAIRCLGPLGPSSPGVQERLLQLINDPFPLVQITAVRALHAVGDERAVPSLKKLIAGDHDGRLKRLAEEAVDRITKGFE